MTISKRQKALVGVCLVALAVLIRDRISIRSDGLGPSRAGASVVPRETDPEQTSVLGSLQSTPLGDRTPSLADKLDGLAEGMAQTGLRDAFCPSEVWLGRTEPGPSQPVLHTDAAKAQRFVQNHKLKAVLIGSGTKLATIDGTCLTIGQEIDGFKLISIDSGSATLALNGQKVTLRLPATPAVEGD